MEEFKLRVYDGVALAGFLMLPALFSTELPTLAGQNGTGGWIALLVAFAVMTGLFLLGARLMERYPGRDILSIASQVLGRPLGAVYGILLSAYFCFCTGVQIREGAEILKLYGLNLTPLTIVALLILGAAVAMNFFGGRAIVKSAGSFFVIIAAGVVFVAALGLTRYNPDYLYPLLGKGLPHIAQSGLMMASMFDGVLILFLFAPAFASPAKMKKSGVLSIAAAAAGFVLLFVCYIMMFSPAVAPAMVSGFIEMGKTSYFNHFFYRFESILLFFLIFSAALQASIGLFAARKSLALAFAPKPHKALTLICMIPILVAIFLPVNLVDLTQNYLPLIRRYSIVFMAGVPLLALPISTIRRMLGHEKN